MGASLTSIQKFCLAEYVSEIVGRGADYAAFSACLLGILEDISGFETIGPSDALIHEIWRLYR
ncbi:hypothetical protein [Paraburkholderia sp. GAS334]|uniref:hypothetical protein n=1 Tax=Paraburkholderia sp. GAS334 TaxID=3035131 RepID=UPI003D1F62FA